MTFTKFFGVILAGLAGALLLAWVFVSLAALLYALVQGNGSAAGTYAIFTVAGVAVGAVAIWAFRRVARTRAARQ